MPPLWKRSWFVAILVLTLIFGMVFWQRHREQKLGREALLERERIESQYEVLKAQINPHFLFNSFNTLASIVEEQTDEAVEFIEKLSDYYRSILHYRNQKLITLDEELRLIADFVYLLKKRFGDHFSVEIMVDRATGYIPPLALQMLVENAVKHNVISRNKPLHIAITEAKDEYIEVSNNYQPKRNREPSTRFGLQNIKNRYKLLTGREVRIVQTEDVFCVQLPVIKQPVK
jgi:LytS/YehU family sensor histidine kinase